MNIVYDPMYEHGVNIKHVKEKVSLAIFQVHGSVLIGLAYLLWLCVKMGGTGDAAEPHCWVQVH
jgi:hypothetical protein